MPVKQAIWAAKRRKELIAGLGGKCKVCGTTEQIEFDHINGRDWQPRKKSRWMRVIIYAREIAQGKIQLLCRSCNASKQ